MSKEWISYFNIVKDEYLAPWGKDEPNPILVEYLKKHPFRKDTTILDSGCAHGRNTNFLLKKDYKVYGIDISKKAIDVAKEKYPNRFLAMDIFDYVDEIGFDIILDDGCLHIMKRNQQYKLIKKYESILRSQGMIFLISFINNKTHPLFYITDTQKMPIEKSKGNVSLPIYGINERMIDFLSKKFYVEYMKTLKSKINPEGIINLVLKRRD